MLIKKANNKIINTENGWHKKNDIKTLLSYEQHRGQISGHNPSVAIYELPDIELLKHTQKDDFIQFTHQLISLITHFTRRSDIKYIYDAHKIVVILLDTRLSGAKTYKKRMTHLLSNYFQEKQQQKYYPVFQGLELSIYTLNQMFQHLEWEEEAAEAEIEEINTNFSDNIVNF